MLGAMFNGRHLVTKDKDGRYFIDADGHLFSHILRYLRTGELPSPTDAEQVYKEAKYFGLEEMALHIEQMPLMMGRLARLQFQSQLVGFDSAVEEILKNASGKQCIVADEVVSFAIIAIHKKLQVVKNKAFDNNHKCYFDLPEEKAIADVYIGPWDKKVKDVSDRVYLTAVTRELKSRGFNVTFNKLGSCSYGVSNPDRIDCKRTIFKLIFHWDKL